MMLAMISALNSARVSNHCGAAVLCLFCFLRMENMSLREALPRRDLLLAIDAVRCGAAPRARLINASSSHEIMLVLYLEVCE